MKPLSLQQIRQAVSGRALAPMPAISPMISAVCTDTRMMQPGSLFIALRGENFDGHNYLPAAAAGGAVAALIDEQPAASQPNVHLIQVPDTKIAMGKLARYVRQEMLAKVIAVAGSNGKTGTKHLIDAALKPKLRGSISPKSFNNDIGVPLTIFPADPFQDYLVLEMGTNHHGEIKVLAEMAQPDVAVITNCGAEHLEGLDDVMGVRRENASILTGLRPSGLLVVNGDDPDLLAAVKDYPKRLTFTFGFNPSNDLYATDVHCDQTGVRFNLNGSSRQVFIPLLGRHTACNALAAIAVARRLGVSEDLIIKGLASSRGPDMRLQLQPMNGVLVLNDAYNANPNSMRAAIETLLSLPTTGRRIAILGDMRELGHASDQLHREMGEFVAHSKVDSLYCVGEKAELLAEAALKAGMAPDQVRKYHSAKEAAEAVPRQIDSGDVLLLKASRAIRLENVASALSAQRIEDARKRIAACASAPGKDRDGRPEVLVKTTKRAKRDKRRAPTPALPRSTRGGGKTSRHA